MDEVEYAMLALGLVGLVYLLMKTTTTVRRNRFLHVTNALGTLVANVVASGWKLFAGGRGKRSSSSQTEPLDLSGTGGRYNARNGNYDNGQDPYGIYPDDDRRL